MCDFPLLAGDGGREWCSGSLGLSLKLLPSIRVGALVPAELKDIVMYIS